MMSLAACAGSSRRAAPPPAPARVTESGTASWYGPGFNGKPTASGEIYDQNAMTAAHKTLPLGARVRVTNMQTRLVVDVRINDRGPFVGNRIIDLSFAAAKVIGMIGPGTAQVLIEVLETPVPIGVVPSALRFTVQIGSFTREKDAEKLRDRAAKTSRDVSVVEARVGDVTYFRVQAGAFSDRAQADLEAQRLRRASFDAIVVER